MIDKANINKSIGARIKTAREIAGLSQEKLAEKIVVVPQTISDMERGKIGPSLLTVILLCEALEVSPNYLLLGDEEVYLDSTIQKIKKMSSEEKKITYDVISSLTDAFCLSQG